jgi:Mrp family chromosome partitioning ATPase
MITTLGDLGLDIRQQEMTKILSKMGKKYIIMSGKGGVGKTTVASMLAWAKAKEGAQVGLIDVDFHGPNLSSILFFEDKIVSDDGNRLIPVKVLDNLHVLCIQTSLYIPDEPVAWRGPRKVRAIDHFLWHTAWPTLDYFFIDSPPGTGDEVMNLATNIRDLRYLIVTTGDPLALADAAKAVNLVKNMQRSPYGLVDNFGFLKCPKCHEEIVLHAPEKVAALGEKYQIPVLARLPWDLEAKAKSYELQRPILEAAPDSQLSLCVKELAKKL